MSLDYAQENASVKTTRVALFSGAMADRQDDDSETQLLLKEMTSTKNSLRMADSYLELAQSSCLTDRSAIHSHEMLTTQRTRLQRSGGVLEGLTNRFPAIQQLTRNVRFRKYRDK